MSSLSVLTDEQIKELLESMTVDELEAFYMDLRGALHDYSVGSQPDEEDADIHQPHRTTINSSRTGATSLFMPSSSPAGLGVKVITLSPPPKTTTTTTTTTENEALSSKPKIKPTGAITLFASTGQPVGILHASTLTAFRTALASACLVIKRNRVHTITAFGSGEQAYWHIRLALMLRGDTIRHVNIINRTFSEGAKNILKRFYVVPTDVKKREGWADAEFGMLTPGYGEYARLLRDQVRAADVIFCCTPSQEPLFQHSILTSGEGRRKGRLIVAIGSYTPDMIELPLEVVHQAVKTHEHGHRHFHKHAVEGGVVVVDTLDGALKEAGEVIQGELSPNQLIELGELVMLHRIKMDEESSSDTGSYMSSEGSSAPTSEFDKLDLSSGPSMSTIFSSSSTENGGSNSQPGSRPSSPSRSSSRQLFHRRRSSHRSAEQQQKKKKDREDHMCRWLQGGNVIYKSVGLGLMDLTVGLRVIEFAKQKGVGTHVDGF
ncbi:hypothetical protein M406DRAFT_295173 [Cryphonectria parasitica EP155]|uniref:Ornithine cyclodeaminase n=1 Tax=Cryphonectria parasitica (strain ATCC 38755 / EP155) TaxID=660469 RepID=A0A9P4XV43_CRYP1|nr:uncharacterized protein M406DRAFT_295173 [Cryphonectria parasitica EP155]KAF3761534.1 hypothetical protein M406DRAFT_295173 [Cryphonectria parasitica EP155]